MEIFYYLFHTLKNCTNQGLDIYIALQINSPFYHFDSQQSILICTFENLKNQWKKILGKYISSSVNLLTAQAKYSIVLDPRDDRPA